MQEHNVPEVEATHVLMDAIVGAAEIVRAAQARAFEHRGRSLVASDVVGELCTVVKELWPTE